VGLKVNWRVVSLNQGRIDQKPSAESGFEGNRPASATIPIGPLALPELLIEADAIAILP
jgi:hypothetical protein